MADFTIHDLDSAPDAAKELLEKSQKAYGMIPNLHGVMAESPEILAGYQELTRLFSASSLSDVERNVVWLAINVESRCHYCVPAHTAIAKSQGTPDDVINALRDGRPLADPRLEALRIFTIELVRARGFVSDAKVAAFLQAGFDKRQVLDVVLGAAHKLMSNYVNHLADTPVDAPFAAFAWETTSKDAA